MNTFQTNETVAQVRLRLCAPLSSDFSKATHYNSLQCSISVVVLRLAKERQSKRLAIVKKYFSFRLHDALRGFDPVEMHKRQHA